MGEAVGSTRTREREEEGLYKAFMGVPGRLGSDTIEPVPNCTI